MGSILWVGIESRESMFAWQPNVETAIASQIFGDGFIWHNDKMFCRVLNNATFLSSLRPHVQLDWLFVLEADDASQVTTVPLRWLGTTVSAHPNYQFYAPVYDAGGGHIQRPSATMLAQD
jgi:hypothetical protein